MQDTERLRPYLSGWNEKIVVRVDNRSDISTHTPLSVCVHLGANPSQEGKAKRDHDFHTFTIISDLGSTK